MDKNDEYRKFAQQAQDLADRTKNPADKASWLKIAESWLRMLPKPRATKQENFDTEAQARGTGQDKSGRSH
jgi:hypothetical protein